MPGDDRHREEVGKGLKPLLPRLWRFGLSLTGDPDAAEELVQATCVRALERASQFRIGTRLDHWTSSIMVSIWKNQLRSEAVRRGAGVIDAELVATIDETPRIEANILAAQVLLSLQALPDSQRAAAFLVYVEGATYKEAAKILGIPIGTIMSRLARARATLAALAEEEPPARVKGERQNGE